MDEWASPAYKNLIDKKILPDVLMGEKNLKDSITRLEFTHLIITYLLSNKNYNLISAKKEYSDVNDTFVNLASNLNITTGYTDGTFKPNMNITRSEAKIDIVFTICVRTLRPITLLLIKSRTMPKTIPVLVVRATIFPMPEISK